MLSLVKRLRHKALSLYYKRNYYRSRVIRPNVPYAPLRYLIDGFTVSPIAETGVLLVERFCSATEAEELAHLARSGATINRSDSRVLPLATRAAMLAGVPASHIEITLNRAESAYTPAPVCQVLVYLTEANESSGTTTRFPALNLSVQPAIGRALVWRASGPPDSDSLSADSDVLTMHLIAHPKRFGPAMPEPAALQTRPGRPLPPGSANLLPEGVWTADEPPPG